MKESLLNNLIIIPAYNEQESIGQVVEKIRTKLSGFDVIVVNDCSTDNTKSVLETSGCKYLDLPINLGIGGAMQTGYLYARENGYDFAVQVDGDGQHDVLEIGKLLKAQKETGADLVIGSRFLGEKSFQSSFMRRVGINLFSYLTLLLSGQKITDATSGFRLAGPKVIDLYAGYYPSDYPEPEVIIYLKKNGLKIVETPVKMNERQGGKSSITPLKSIYYMVKVVGSMLLQKVKD
jgi:glycosyltransferase involved in cell wall biosynthesis